MPLSFFEKTKLKKYHVKVIIGLTLTLTLTIFFLPYNRLEFGYNPDSYGFKFFYQEILKAKSFWENLVIAFFLCTPLILSIEITQKKEITFRKFGIKNICPYSI